LYRKYIEQTLYDHLLSDITPGTVRAWRAELIAGGIAATMVAKAYRLLRAVLNTAVDDELIRRNPCRIKGAGTERAPSGLPRPWPRSSTLPALQLSVFLQLDRRRHRDRATRLPLP
jgi:hypothetical protein